jgi:hypothetical protein
MNDGDSYIAAVHRRPPNPTERAVLAVPASVKQRVNQKVILIQLLSLCRWNQK